MKELWQKTKFLTHRPSNLQILELTFFFFFCYFVQNRASYLQLILRQLINSIWNLGSLIVLSQVPVFSQTPLLVLITVGHTIHPPIEGLLPKTGVEFAAFWNSASKVAGLQMHATKTGLNISNTSKYGRKCLRHLIPNV